MPADYLPDDPAGGEENDPPTVDDPDDFGPWLLHVRERAGRGVMTHLKLHLNLRFL